MTSSAPFRSIRKTDRESTRRSGQCDVSCNERQAVDLGGCCQEAVDQWQWVRNAEHRPGFGDRLVDRQDAVAEPRSHLREPPIKRFGLLRIAPPLQFDAAADLRQNNDA